MASNIISSSIDETFPVAGQDNNSQGFRDNFSAIKAGLATAASEITDLQNGSASLSRDNDFAGHAVTNAVYNKFHGAVLVTNNVNSSSVPVSVNNGPYQVLTLGTGSTFTITFQDWPDITGYGPVYANLKLHIFSNQSGSKTINFATANGGVVKPEVTLGGSSVTLPADSTSKVVEFWTYNGGNTVFMRVIGTF